MAKTKASPAKRNEPPAPGAAAELECLTPEEYQRRRAEYIRAGKGTPPPGATPLPGADDPGSPTEPKGDA